MAWVLCLNKSNRFSWFDAIQSKQRIPKEYIQIVITSVTGTLVTFALKI